MAIVILDASKATPSKGLNYITNPEKAALITSRNLDKTEDFEMQMRRTAKLWGKAQEHEDRKYYHLKISFAKEDWVKNGGTLTEEKAMQIVNKIMAEFFYTRESVAAVHTDTDILHVHGIINAVDLMDGKMLDMRNAEYRKLKDRVQEICREYHLIDIDWRRATKEKREREAQEEGPIKESFAEKGIKERGKSPWKDLLRIAIDSALEKCCTIEEFKAFLSEEGIELTRCTEQTISYKMGEHKACRGDTLGGDYTMQAVKDALSHNKENLEVESSKQKPKLDEKIGAADTGATPDRIIGLNERKMLRELGRLAGVKRSEIDEWCDSAPKASWEEKQQVWAECMAFQESFWKEYAIRQHLVQKEIENAYKKKKLVRHMEWMLDPRNRRRSLVGVIIAAIYFSRNDSTLALNFHIESLKKEQEALRREKDYFKTVSGEAFETLRQKGLSLDSYRDAVKDVQKMAQDMHFTTFSIGSREKEKAQRAIEKAAKKYKDR